MGGETCKVSLKGGFEYFDQTGSDPIFQNMLPFPGTPVYAAMGAINVMPGRFYDTAFAYHSFVGKRTPCTAYSDRIIFLVESELANTFTPAGEPITTIWEEEVDVDGSTAAEALIMREVLRTMQFAPAPSLRGEFLAAGTVKTLAQGAAAGFNAQSRSILPHAGAVAAGTAVVGNPLIAATDAVLGLAGPALMVTEFAPELLGMASSKPD